MSPEEVKTLAVIVGLAVVIGIAIYAYLWLIYGGGE